MDGQRLVTAYGGKYRPIATLGQGGMASVHLTVMQSAPGVNKLLVVKSLRPELVSDAEFSAMFVDEARLAARLNHPNVVQTFEIGEEHGVPFLVMEYLEGQPLHAILPRVGRAKMPVAASVWILAKALAGLHYAHELRDFDGAPLEVVHRDVSPQNVFVCYDGQVKVLDFGIAKASGSITRTDTGVFKGKLGYISPEQIAGTKIDRRADIFSVGVMLWEALTWRRLTHGDSEAVVISKRTSGNVPRVRDFNPDVPAALARICERAMSLSPEDRWSTAAEMQHALEEHLHESGTRVTERDVGAIVSEAFATERDKIRAAIEAQLANESASRLLSLAPPMTPSVPPPPLLGSVPPPDPSSVTIGHTRGSRRAAVYVAGGAAAAVLGGVVLFAASRGSATTKDESPTAPSVSSRPSALATSNDVSAPASVKLDVRVQPPGARVTLDGAPLSGNPARATFPRDGRAHTLRASAPGYAAESRELTFDHDVEIELVLRAAPVFGAPPPPTSDPQGTPSAGVDLKKDPKPKHAIDEKDPYK